MKIQRRIQTRIMVRFCNDQKNIAERIESIGKFFETRYALSLVNVIFCKSCEYDYLEDKTTAVFMLQTPFINSKLDLI